MAEDNPLNVSANEMAGGIVPTTPVIGAEEQQLNPEPAEQAKPKPPPIRKIQARTIKPGVLLNFNYKYRHNDPSPLMIVAINGKNPTTHLWANGLIAGVNLHYLTNTYVKKLIKLYCNNANFGYSFIKHDFFVYKSWRSYKPDGMINKRILDSEAIQKVLDVVRRMKINPTDTEAIKNEIRKQLQQQFNQSTDELINLANSNLKQNMDNRYTFKNINNGNPPYVTGDPRFNPSANIMQSFTNLEE